MARTVLITGACGELGTALARVYLERGDTVIGADLADPPPDLAAFDRFRHYRVDLTDREDLARFVASLSAGGGLPQIVICNAALHADDNTPFLDFDLLLRVMDVNLLAVLHLLSLLMPILAGPCVFVYCGSGVVIFPNPGRLGYYLGKLGATKTFDLFSYRYARRSFTFKSIVLGPLASPMLDGSQPPNDLAAWLRRLTTGEVDSAARRIAFFVDRPGRRLYFRKTSMMVLWTARLVQRLLPQRLRVYQA